MKIAMINKFYPPVIGGIEYHVRVLSENLACIPAIEKVEVLVANIENCYMEENVAPKIHIQRLKNWKTIASTPLVPTFAQSLRNLDVDLFHFHFPYPFGDFSWLFSGNKKPFIITYHSDILRQKYLNYFYGPIRDKFFSQASRIIATSPNLVQSSPVLQKFREKVSVVPLGIDPKPYLDDDALIRGTQIRSAFGDRPIVLFVGRLVYYKGVEILIKAFKDIDAELIMIGKGPLKEKLYSMVAELGIGDKVHFFSNVSDKELAAYFNASDIFVLPSIANTEAYGLVQLEAQVCGKPVISTNLQTGVPFVNKDGETGLVVSPNDVSALKGSIQKLINDKSMRLILGQQAKKRMLENFTDEEMTRQIYNIYLDVINNKKSL